MFRHYMSRMEAALVLAVLLVSSGAASGEVRFEIRPHKATIVLGEPLIVSTVVKNLTNLLTDVVYQNSSPIAVMRLSAEAPPALDDPRILYRWFRNAWYDEFSLIRKRLPSTLGLDPDEEVTFEPVFLYRRTKGFAFDEPGAYWISGRIVVVAREAENSSNYNIAADPVAITVNEPERADRQVWHWLSAHGEQYGALVQIPGTAELSDEFVNGCRDLCATSDSVYVEYLALFLSRWYAGRQGNNPAEAVRFAEIAKARASSDLVRDLAAKVLARATEAVAAEKKRQQAARAAEPPPERPVEPKVRSEVKAVFEAFIAAAAAGDFDRCLQMMAEDFWALSRDRQRWWLEYEFTDVIDLREQGVPFEYSAHILSAVRRGEEVILTARLFLTAGSEPSEDRIVRCWLRKHADVWLLQLWGRVASEK